MIIGSVAVCIRLKTGGPMIGLFFSWIIIYLFCKWFKIKYDHVVSGAYDAIRVVVPTLCLLMAIGNAMGINPGMVAGAVICGAMFGDKLSPLSDTTNLAPAVAGAKLNDHVRSMLWTTLPTFVISLVLFVILGISQTSV